MHTYILQRKTVTIIVIARDHLFLGSSFLFNTYEETNRESVAT